MTSSKLPLLPVHRLQFFTEHCQNRHHVFTQRLAGGRNICKNTHTTTSELMPPTLLKCVYKIIKKIIILYQQLYPVTQTFTWQQTTCPCIYSGFYCVFAQRAGCVFQRTSLHVNLPLLCSGTAVASSPSDPCGGAQHRVFLRRVQLLIILGPLCVFA